ncbi:hypothetical protein Pmar_PMAR012626 [Perkinsus marinus ATCC 50983]|uniref:Uncharacterized protein n=1 Tax=Perkinsus marinus (strain ATCC 50983 / TXsc) TaxID=423536 RepID=C5K7V9_PERM5|nr:hypothetical protein Pmar_PMAR012626 [Perkinsus marinus ATCC 50983]EER19644.1 hypothetical protein Pmar_PMAR012626 [Perkinsus marinus ATCC 50983]|eukprot:XP_002787848.1 hypothetical protein Pmar_PMAR012626 [Perkinsus marinus ATCC 50983]
MANDIFLNTGNRVVEELKCGVSVHHHDRQRKSQKISWGSGMSSPGDEARVLRIVWSRLLLHLVVTTKLITQQRAYQAPSRACGCNGQRILLKSGIAEIKILSTSLFSTRRWKSESTHTATRPCSSKDDVFSRRVNWSIEELSVV